MNSEKKQCETVWQMGRCVTPTTITCIECDQYVCASCCEDSWLQERPYTCPACDEKAER